MYIHKCTHNMNMWAWLLAWTSTAHVHVHVYVRVHVHLHPVTGSAGRASAWYRYTRHHGVRVLPEAAHIFSEKRDLELSSGVVVFICLVSTADGSCAYIVLSLETATALLVANSAVVMSPIQAVANSAVVMSPIQADNTCSNSCQ